MNQLKYRMLLETYVGRFVSRRPCHLQEVWPLFFLERASLMSKPFNLVFAGMQFPKWTLTVTRSNQTPVGKRHRRRCEKIGVPTQLFSAECYLYSEPMRSFILAET